MLVLVCLSATAVRTEQPAGGADAVREAMRLRDLKTADGLRQSAGKLEEAVALFRQAADIGGEAAALQALGETHIRLGDFRQAVVAFEQGLSAHRTLDDSAGQAAALAGMGAALIRLNEYQRARDALNQSLPLYRRLGHRSGEASALHSLGAASFSQDAYAEAIAFYESGLELARAGGQRGLEATIVYSIGQTYYHLGEYQKALDLYTQALAGQRVLLNRSAEAATLSAIGRVYRFLGEYQKALDHHAQALTILRAIGERMNEATSLNNSGHVYLSIGEYRKALPLFEESLAICRSVGNQSGIASNTNGVGLVHAGLQEYRQAIPFHVEALRLSRQIGHRRAEADSLGHLGRVFHALDDYPQARAHLTDALAIYRDVRVRRQESETLFALARTDRSLGDLAAAESHVNAALTLTESFRQDVVSQQLRTSYQATVRDLYELKIDVLMRRLDAGAPAEVAAQALATSERARARSLLDVLAEAGAEIRQDVDPGLLERERTIRQLLAGLAARQNELASARSQLDQLTAVAREIEAAAADYDGVQAKIRESSPRYAALTQPEPLTTADLQREVLDADTVLLEYFLGAERSYVWVVTSDGLTWQSLPGRAAIEDEARRFHQLAAGGGRPGDLEQSARRLSTIVLAPVASQLVSRRVAVVADGALHYVPFGALPLESEAGRSQPLIVTHEVVSLPSASTLASLRRETAGRTPAPNLIAVVADPVFDAGDVRVRRGSAADASRAAEAHAPAMRSAADVGLGQGRWPPPRLLGTRREARAILSLAPAARSREALGFDASRDTALSGGLGSFQVLHFATHALINNQHPELSGLVLSLVDRDGRPRDGFLRLNDIYNLRFAAELVVLSACQTGLGKEISGEGLIGLTRGFMYAGAPRLIASLWPVDDRATSELMERFYRSLLGPRQLSAAAALREAQIEMWRQKDWQSLQYWAAFTLQGEWKPTPAPARAR